MVLLSLEATIKDAFNFCFFIKQLIIVVIAATLVLLGCDCLFSVNNVRFATKRLHLVVI